MNCPSCATPRVRVDQRFCARCGTELAWPAPARPPVPPPPPARPPTAPALPPDVRPAFPPAGPVAPYDEGRGGGSRGGVVLLVALALFAALIGAGGVVLLLRDDDSGTTAQDDRTADERIEGEGAGGETAGTDQADDRASAETDGPAEPATTEAAADFTCWDSTTVAKASGCAAPTGAAGLTWVFPSASDDSCAVTAGGKRVTEAECYPEVEGVAVRFHYSEWRSRRALETYYGRNQVGWLGAPAGHPDLTAVEVVSRDSAVDYKVAIYYTDPSVLWSVTIYAGDQAQYLLAEGILQSRPFRQLLGKRA